MKHKTPFYILMSFLVLVSLSYGKDAAKALYEQYLLNIARYPSLFFDTDVFVDYNGQQVTNATSDLELVLTDENYKVISSLLKLNSVDNQWYSRLHFSMDNKYAAILTGDHAPYTVDFYDLINNAKLASISLEIPDFTDTGARSKMRWVNINGQEYFLVIPPDVMDGYLSFSFYSPDGVLDRDLSRVIELSTGIYAIPERAKDKHPLFIGVSDEGKYMITKSNITDFYYIQDLLTGHVLSKFPANNYDIDFSFIGDEFMLVRTSNSTQIISVYGDKIYELSNGFGDNYGSCSYYKVGDSYYISYRHSIVSSSNFRYDSTKLVRLQKNGGNVTVDELFFTNDNISDITIIPSVNTQRIRAVFSYATNEPRSDGTTADTSKIYTTTFDGTLSGMEISEFMSNMGNWDIIPNKLPVIPEPYNDNGLRILHN